jgi:hypothetical protein
MGDDEQDRTQETDIVAIVASSDLMTGSRFVAEGVVCLVRRSADAAMAAAGEHPDAAVFVDLTAFPELPAQIAHREGPVHGFAPHVREDLLDAARDACASVLPRGAAIKRFGVLARSAHGTGGG